MPSGQKLWATLCPCGTACYRAVPSQTVRSLAAPIILLQQLEQSLGPSQGYGLNVTDGRQTMEAFKASPSNETQEYSRKITRQQNNASFVNK